MLLASCDSVSNTDTHNSRDNQVGENKENDTSKDSDKGNNDITELPAPEKDDFVYTLKGDGTYSLALSAESTLISVTVPKEYNGASVTEIAERGFYKSGITQIVIPETVIAIGKEAFYECASLKNVSLANGTVSIGDSAFRYCTSLDTISIPKTLQSIGASAFDGCTALTEITLPISVTSIADYAFAHCSALAVYCEAVSKPATWKSKWNFSSCPVIWDCKNALQDVRFITYHGLRYEIVNNEAFVTPQAKSVTEAIIPEKIISDSTEFPVTKIADNAFNGCEVLSSVIIPRSVKEIGKQAFSGCSSLTKVIIPDSVLKIGEHAFSFCNNLILYCEASAQPKNWSLYFTDKEPIWGYKENQ